MSDRLSEYANGSYGSLMTVSFFTLGAGMIVLGLGLARTTKGWPRIVPLAVIVAGCGMVVSGFFPTDPVGEPTTSERVHSLASGSASMLLIGAAVAFALLSGARGTRRAIGPLSVLAFTALGLGAASPLLHETDWAGLSQRLLWLALMAWLLLAAWQAGSRDKTLTAR